MTDFGGLVTCPHPSHGEPQWFSGRFLVEVCDDHRHMENELEWLDYMQDLLAWLRMKPHQRNLFLRHGGRYPLKPGEKPEDGGKRLMNALYGRQAIVLR